MMQPSQSAWTLQFKTTPDSLGRRHLLLSKLVDTPAKESAHQKKKPRGLSAATSQGRDPEVKEMTVTLKDSGVQCLPNLPDGLSQFGQLTGCT
jgi:hypothetical protein